MTQLGSRSVLLASATILMLLTSTGTKADSGTIEFSDQAPPPSEQKVALGKAWSARVGILADQINRLSAVLQATALLRDSLAVAGQPSSSQLESIQPLIANWGAARGGLFTSSQGVIQPINPETFYGEVPQAQPMWSFNTDGIAAYVGAAISLSAQLKSVPVSNGEHFGVDGLPQHVASALQEQSVWFDELVAEHSILNRRIRYYPYLQPQTPVACEVINKFSQMIKCVEASAGGPIGDQSWVYGVAQLSDYCVADNAQSYSAPESVHLSVRVKRALLDAPVFPQLLEARVANPLGSKQLGLKCQ